MTTTHADPPNGRHPNPVAGSCDDGNRAAELDLGDPRKPRDPATYDPAPPDATSYDPTSYGPASPNTASDNLASRDPASPDRAPRDRAQQGPQDPREAPQDPREGPQDPREAPQDPREGPQDPREAPQDLPDRTPRRRPGRPRSEAAERAILDAVLELLGQGVPYRSLSMEQVAARAAVGKATVYRRWPNKESLVVDAVTTLWTDCPAPDLTDGRSTRDRLVEYLVTMADLMHSDRAGLVFASVMATGMTNPELVRRYQQVAIEPRREQVRAILRHGIAHGELRPDLDIELTVRMLAGPIVHTMKTEFLDEPLPESFVAALVDALLRGAAAR